MRKIDSQEIIKNIARDIAQFKPEARVRTVGTIESIGDGVVEISGLPGAKMGEILEFPQKTYGLVLNLGKDRVGAVVLGDDSHLAEGDEVSSGERLMSVPVSPRLLGRVVDPLMRPLDGVSLDEDDSVRQMPVERIAPGVVEREPVKTPLQTGIKAIDAMIPIGRGQRELIIGDRGTGKTAIAVDTIINQKDSGVVCVYVAIGQREAQVARVAARLRETGALEHTVIVSAAASDPAALQYLAPYAGCAIGEYFLEEGKDALVVYDDLSKHAWAYRQVSLLLRRPTGREAYPGDIFYLHSRLLERAVKLNQENGGGSLTALPIIETQAGDVSAYIPTNVISITDGQIYLEPDLFYAGVRPAISVGLSVSRVGGAAQIKAMKKVAGKLRLDLAQYRELEAFARFGSDLDPATKASLDRGERMTELLKQTQYQPMAVERQVAVIWAGVNGYLDQIPPSEVARFAEEFLERLEALAPEVLVEIKETKDLSEAVEKKLGEIAGEFVKTFLTEG
jgi:F-type H+-transporting ATPase subunit alpha